MSIFNFTDEQSLGEVRSVETSRITVRVTDGQRLQKARVGRLVAIQLMGDEWLIGIIERVWRHPVELPTLPEADPSKMDFGAAVTGAKAWKEIWGCGQGIGAVDKIVPTSELVDRLATEYQQAKRDLLAA